MLSIVNLYQMQSFLLCCTLQVNVGRHAARGWTLGSCASVFMTLSWLRNTNTCVHCNILRERCYFFSYKAIINTSLTRCLNHTHLEIVCDTFRSTPQSTEPRCCHTSMQCIKHNIEQSLVLPLQINHILLCCNMKLHTIMHSAAIVPGTNT